MVPSVPCERVWQREVLDPVCARPELRDAAGLTRDSLALALPSPGEPGVQAGASGTEQVKCRGNALRSSGGQEENCLASF